MTRSEGDLPDEAYKNRIREQGLGPAIRAQKEYGVNIDVVGGALSVTERAARALVDKVTRRNRNSPR